ncbi:MAG TPA: Hsp20/alpha crystallin family protein [Bacilli bacterium]|nr:Hsp20/alpha crystallin family protein [Bacilli bacterium]
MSNYLRKRNDLGFLGDSFLRDFFEDSPINRGYQDLMKTDVIKKENGYEIKVNMPGYAKENIKLNLEKGYLTIEGHVEKTEEPVADEEKQEKYLRRERFYGSITRSYYLGDDIDEEKIKANFADGVLNVVVQKIDPAKLETKKYIAIE